MPKYTSDVVAGYSLYFTSKCIVEAMHVHTSDGNCDGTGSAKLYVYENGDTKITEWGSVNEIDMRKIQLYIKNNYKVMYKKWRQYSDNGYYNKR